MSVTEKIKILVNGKEHLINFNETLECFLVSWNIKPSSVVAELNMRVIPRDKFPKIKLNHGDKLEIVQVVGGG